MNQSQLRRHDLGLTLIEVMVTLVILLLGLLGDPASAAMWSQLQSHSITDCTAAACTPVELANYDLATWEGLLLGAGKSNASNLRIGSISHARGCVEGPVASMSPGVAAPANTYRITVTWQGDQAVPTSADNANDLRNLTTCAQGQYLTLANSLDSADEYRRLVTLYVFIYQPT